MKRLVCDVGGTNTRLGFAVDGILLPETVQSFANDDFAGFRDVALAYLGRCDGGAPTQATVAVAGPVSNGSARLTNRDWVFDAAVLSDQLRMPVVLLNDLSALGASLADLGPDDLLHVAGQVTHSNGQRLVAGIGTGFNVSPAISMPDRVMCPEVEFGHVSLPQDIADHLAAGSSDMKFDTVEDLFSGRGFKAFQRTGGTLNDYAACMALLAGNLLMAFLPRDGIYFAGGVARHVLQSGGLDVFRSGWEVDRYLGLGTSVSCILDDAAALKGCARYMPNSAAAP